MNFNNLLFVGRQIGACINAGLMGESKSQNIFYGQCFGDVTVTKSMKIQDYSG